MDPYDTFTMVGAARRSYRRGGSSTALLAVLSTYLERTADWPVVRDVMLDDLKMSHKAILDWFAAQDFPDFQEAVEEGWGWPSDA